MCARCDCKNNVGQAYSPIDLANLSGADLWDAALSNTSGESDESDESVVNETGSPSGVIVLKDQANAELRRIMLRRVPPPEAPKGTNPLSELRQNAPVPRIRGQLKKALMATRKDANAIAKSRTEATRAYAKHAAAQLKKRSREAGKATKAAAAAAAAAAKAATAKAAAAKATAAKAAAVPPAKRSRSAHVATVAAAAPDLVTAASGTAAAPELATVASGTSGTVAAPVLGTTAAGSGTDDFKALLESLKAKGIPTELHPPVMPRGKLSYTMKSFNGATIEVHHVTRKEGGFFYIKKAAPGYEAALNPSTSRNYTWSRFGGVDATWALVKALIDPEWVTLL